MGVGYTALSIMLGIYLFLFLVRILKITQNTTNSKRCHIQFNMISLNMHKYNLFLEWRNDKFFLVTNTTFTRIKQQVISLYTVIIFIGEVTNTSLQYHWQFFTSYSRDINNFLIQVLKSIIIYTTINYSHYPYQNNDFPNFLF